MTANKNKFLFMDEYEHGIILKSLIEAKNRQSNEDRSAGLYDNLILKAYEAPVKKNRPKQICGYCNESR